MATSLSHFKDENRGEIQRNGNKQQHSTTADHQQQSMDRLLQISTPEPAEDATMPQVQFKLRRRSTSNANSTKSGPVTNRVSRACIKYLGSLYAATSSFFFSLQAICMKSVFSIAPYEMAIVQSGFQAIPSGFALLCLRINPFTYTIIRRSAWKLILRGIFGGAVVMLRILSLRYLPIGDCSVILFSSPIFVAALSPILLKEPVTKYIAVAIVLTTAGLLLVSRPEFLFGHTSFSAASTYGNVTLDERVTGILAAIGGATMAAGISLVLRGLKAENEHVVMFWYGCTATIGASIITAALNDFRMPSFDWPYILLAGLFQYLSQFTQTLAFQRDSAASVSIVRTTEIIWAYLWQVTWFHEPVSWVALAGAAFVLLSIVMVTYDKHRMVKKAKLLAVNKAVDEYAAAAPNEQASAQPVSQKTATMVTMPLLTSTQTTSPSDVEQLRHAGIATAQAVRMAVGENDDAAATDVDPDRSRSLLTTPLPPEAAAYRYKCRD